MTTEDDGAQSACPSGPGETAEATTPTLNWPAWLEEYYQADQADRIAGRLYDESSKDPDLKEAEEAALTNLHNIVAAIEGTPADSQEALAVKLAMQWNYHTDFPLDNNNELTDPLNGELILLRTTLDSLAAQTGLSLFEIYGHDGRAAFPDPTDEPDAGLLWLEREHLRNVHYIDNPPLDNPSRKILPDETYNAYADRRNEILQKVARTIAASPAGVAAKMRLLREEFESLKSAWADEGWETCLTSLTNMADMPTPAAQVLMPNTTSGKAHKPKPDNPDAKLFALEVETHAAHKGLDAAEPTEEANEPWYRRINAAQDTAIATSAQTEAGVMAKLRMTAWFLDNPSETDEVYANWLRSVVADAQRIGATASVDPDAELQGLWREYLQNRVDWNKTEEDTPEYERCHEESTAIATRISATPAQGIVGLAVKIMIAANEPYEHEAVADQTTLDDKALISARDDATRLTGIGGAA